jgi:hypothetical protein
MRSVKLHHFANQFKSGFSILLAYSWSHSIDTLEAQGAEFVSAPCAGLEIELQGDLQNTWIKSGCNATEAGRGHRGRERGISGHGACRGNGSDKVGVVEDVKHIEARLQVESFADFEKSANGGVEIHCARTANGVAGQVAKGAEWIGSEGGRIQVLDAWISAVHAAGIGGGDVRKNLIGSIIAEAGERIIFTHGDVQRLTAGRVNEGRQFPSAEQTIDHGATALHLARDHQRCIEVVACIEDAASPIRVAVEGLGVGRASERGAEVGIGNAVRQSVVRQEREVISEAMLQ